MAPDGGDPTLESLRGEYDVFFALPSSLPPGCRLRNPATRLNLLLRAEVGPMLFYDYAWPAGFADATRTLDTLRVTTSFGTDSLPSVELRLGASGFSGVGTASLPLRCADGSNDHVEVPATIAPDTTPPVVKLVPLGTVPFVFPFTESFLEVSEPTDLEGMNELDATVTELSLAESLVTLSDADTGDAFPFTFTKDGRRRSVVSTFTDQLSIQGRRFSLKLLTTFHDRAGNTGVADGTAFTVERADPIHLTPTFDFDTETVSSVHGNVTRYAPGDPDSPCESGGCLVLEQAIRSCADPGGDTPQSFIAVLLDESVPGDPRYNYRIWSTATPAPNLWVQTPGCHAEIASNVEPVAAPSGPYLYAGPQESEPLGCNPLVHTGAMISLGCVYGPASGTARLVLESIGLETYARPDAGP